MIPGEIIGPDDMIALNAGRADVTLLVDEHAATVRCRSVRTTTSPKSTPRCRSTAVAARGFRLDIAAGTSVRFEPGISMRGHVSSPTAARASWPGSAASSAGAIDG